MCFFLPLQADFKKFKKTFEEMALPGAGSVREREWSRLDGNGSLKVSLAEFDGWIKFHLKHRWSTYGNVIWRNFKPCYIRAFDEAKTSTPGEQRLCLLVIMKS